MKIYFSGIGGTAIGPLALIAHQAGHEIAGSDKQSSNYIKYLQAKGIKDIYIGQTKDQIQKSHDEKPIDWLVYSSAVSIENPNHPELLFAKENNIKATKRDELLNELLETSNKKLLAIAGTHGKTTTTAMLIWMFKELNIPISYSVGAKISFGDMGHFDDSSEYFVYECDEFDRNFLSFSPYLSLISGIDYDHHEIFPTEKDYMDAFIQFLGQSESQILWLEDLNRLENFDPTDNTTIFDENSDFIDDIHLPGLVNRKDAWLVVAAVNKITNQPIDKLISIVERFPGLSRRFERIATNLYSDYAHTIPKIQGCLQLAKEVSEKVVVVYEPLTDRRQHYIKDQYSDLFSGVEKLYWVPSYLAREDPKVEILRPEDLIKTLNNQQIAMPAKLDNELKSNIEKHLSDGALVVALSGGGGGSLDEWLRHNFKNNS